jgi:hypothetical protein
VISAVAVLVSVSSDSTSSSTFGDPGEDDERVASPPPAEVECIRAAFIADNTFVSAAIAESNSLSGVDVDHAWSRLADALAGIDLSQCPISFATAFDRYVTAVAQLGAFFEDRTGTAALDDIFSDDDFDETTRMLATNINIAYEDLRAIGRESGVEAPRGSLSVG